MTLEKIIRVLWRATRDRLYRREIAGRIGQKIDNRTLFPWLWRGVKRRVWSPPQLSAAQVSSSAAVNGYIRALRFNQSPHPEHHLARTRRMPQSESGGAAPKFIAYYLPQFHPFEINDQAWGEGFTEWTNTTKALPQYKGHYQPHLPADLGHYDLRVPDVMRKQIEIAKSYGVHGFCFHYYWFDGKKVMDLPLNQFLAHPDMDQSFCICWANENWTRRWDGMESDVLLQQTYAPEKCLEFIHDIIPVFNDPRYIRVDGKPLLIIYRPLLIPDLGRVVETWREAVIKAGLPGLWLVCAQTFGLQDPGPIGFDAAVEFPPHKINDHIEETPVPQGIFNPEFKGKTWLYDDAVAEALTREVQPYPLYRCAFPSWDNEARRTAAGYSFIENSPSAFGEWLATCVSYAQETQNSNDKLVFINAWNEWAEGAHLEPDRHYGYAWLEQVALQSQKICIEELPPLSYGVTITPSQKSVRIAVVAHVYYEETWPDMVQGLQALAEPFDLIITTTPEKQSQVMAMVKSTHDDAEIHVIENKGRDIRPFIALMPLLLKRQYQAVLKLHSKKSLHRRDGDLWRQTLIAQLLPRGADLLSMTHSLAKYPSLGLIAPEGNVLNLQRYIGSNMAWVEKLVIELGETTQWLENAKPWFAAGSMFWFKPKALQSLLYCESIQKDLFEAETGQIDGTLAHAIERILGCVTLASGYHMVDTMLARKISSSDAGVKQKAQKTWMNQWSRKGRQRTIDSPFARPTETSS